MLASFKEIIVSPVGIREKLRPSFIFYIPTCDRTRTLPSFINEINKNPRDSFPKQLIPQHNQVDFMQLLVQATQKSRRQNCAFSAFALIMNVLSIFTFIANQ